MWRMGDEALFIAWCCNAAALSFCLLLGLRAFFDPRWASRFVRLVPDPERPGGFAEFRATYGGVFIGSHLIALFLSGNWIVHGSFELGMYATAAAAVLAAAWGGACAGRVLSILSDGTRTSFNVRSAIIEALLALAIAAPMLKWLAAGTS